MINLLDENNLTQTLDTVDLDSESAKRVFGLREALENDEYHTFNQGLRLNEPYSNYQRRYERGSEVTFKAESREESNTIPFNSKFILLNIS